MADVQIFNNLFNTSEHFDIPNIDLIQNYSVLINKLEQLALGVDATLDNISLDHNNKALTVALGNGEFMGDPIAASRAGPPHVSMAHGLEEVEYSRVVSDIWIGVILTLLIVSVIFFICACFLYHKFQQWKNSCKFYIEEEKILIKLKSKRNKSFESQPFKKSEFNFFPISNCWHKTAFLNT